MPRRGGLHPLALRRGDGTRVRTGATHVVVVSEDAWNRAMSTAICVPVYPGPPAVALFHVGLGDLGHADVSRALSLPRDALGDELDELGRASLDDVARAVAAYLDLDALAQRRTRRPVPTPSDQPTARQKSIHWADLGLEERKRVLVLSPDERNAVAPYVSALYVTSRDRRNRRAWQVPAAGGWVITGDLILQPQRALEHRRRPTPARATADEMAEVAVGVRGVLRA